MSLRVVLYALGASLPLLVGGALGAFWSAPKRLLAAALGFATGALIASLAFELVEQAYRDGARLAVLAAFAAGTAVFVVADTALDRFAAGGSAVGLALLAGVTLDGIPENAALGVTLVHGGSPALLVGVLVSNLPESLAGAARMRSNGRSKAATIAVWAAATALLALAVVAGRLLLEGAGQSTLALPLAFAAGAVLASLIDTLAPEAFQDGGPWVAVATAAGFALAAQLALGS